MKRRMVWKQNSYQITVDDWLRTSAFSILDGRTLDDIHFDCLIGPWTKARDGVVLVAQACEMLERVAAALPLHANLHDVRDAIVALPIRLTEEMKLWKPRYWRKAGMGYEPPSLMLLKSDAFYQRFGEEYSRELELSIDGHEDVKAIYKSYREPSEPDVGNTIFLYLPRSGSQPFDTLRMTRCGS